MDTVNNNYLFVYGTLKRGRVRHEILIEENAEFVDEAVLEGYNLYDIGYYPGIVEGSGKVYGEVYKVSDKLIEILDAIEGVERNLFKRKILPVELMSQKTKLYVFVYVFQRKTKYLQLIANGKY